MKSSNEFWKSPFRPGGTADISRWRNHRYRMQTKLAPWKGAGPKLSSVALSGLEEFSLDIPVVSPPANIPVASGAEEHFLESSLFDPQPLIIYSSTPAPSPDRAR